MVVPVLISVVYQNIGIFELFTTNRVLYRRSELQDPDQNYRREKVVSEIYNNFKSLDTIHL